MKRLVLYAFVLLTGLSFSCATDYVTGKKTFSLISESQEIAIGKEADPAIQAEYGIYDDPALTAYVDSIGQSIVRVSHRPNLQYTFRIVDSPIVNAFALPGGWVYFTRGIFAHFNSEAELAGVMGHEIGHVVARHGAEQMSKAQLASIGLGIGSLVSEKFNQWSGLAETGLGLIFLSYGRNQESESDRLGVEYSTKLGYDAHKMAEFFKTIGRISDQGGQRIPTFLSTHPDPGDREANVHQLTNEWQTQVNYRPKDISKASYLRRIEGIVYGDDPRQGFAENGMFYHPELRFQFPVPTNWKLQNSPAVVVMADAEQKAMIQFKLDNADSPQAAASAFVTNSGATEVARAQKSVHGLPAVALETTLTTQSGNLRILSYFISKDNKVYVFHGYSAEANFGQYAGTLTSVMSGFDVLRNQAALSKKPDRIRIAKVRAAGTFENAARQLSIPPDKIEQLALLNGLVAQDQVAQGDLIKILGQ
ncbi:M48 family metalloprotease [candidate division KSB1 bacterium]|nr:M48 family metalloprotease [candidate division KSB1 bacterium]